VSSAHTAVSTGPHGGGAAGRDADAAPVKYLQVVLAVSQPPLCGEFRHIFAAEAFTSDAQSQMAASPLHSVVVASEFRASDYLIPLGGALGSPSGSEAPSPAAKGCVAASPPRGKHHLMRVVCPPAGQEADVDECQTFRSASTASIPAETRSPNHRGRRRPAWPASGGGAGASSSGESDVGDDAEDLMDSLPAAAACPV
jgi:hypothetical protein